MPYYIFWIAFLIIIGVVLHKLFRVFSNYSIGIFRNRVYLENYFLSPLDFVFLIISFFLKPVDIFFIYLGFLGTSIYRKLFVKKDINFLKNFLSGLCLFVPLGLLSYFVNFFKINFGIENIFRDFFILSFLVLGYVVVNRFLSLWVIYQYEVKDLKLAFYTALSRAIDFNFLDIFIFIQFIPSYLFVLLFKGGKYFEAFIIIFLNYFYFSIVKIMENLYIVYKEVVDTIIRTLEEYDFDTKEHSERVAVIAKLLAKKLNLSFEEIQEIELTAKLHDIGKIYTPSFIIKKQSKLTPFEYKIITFHSLVGAKMLEFFLDKQSVDYIKYHHLYPNIDKKVITYEDVPIGARIITIADIYDALRSKRSYKQTISVEQVLDIMQNEVHKKTIDPTIFKIFYDNLREIEKLAYNR